MAWFRKPGEESQFDREISFHLEQLVAEKIAGGMSPQEARRQAALEFGGREQVKEELRDVRRWAMVEAAAANLRAALRFMRRSPGFSIAVILTLALGIGANSAVFSAIDAVLLRALPFPHGDELVALNQWDSRNKNPQSSVAPVRLEEWNRMNSTFQAITGYYTEEVSESSGQMPERLTEAQTAPRFLQVWGVAPMLGRDFSPEEEHFGGPAAVLISDRLWRRRFQADPAAIGKKLHFGSYSPTIVGVMPASFLFPNREVDVWTPSPADAPYAQSREAVWYITVGRMKPGVSLERARADLAMVQGRLGKEFPKFDKDLGVQVQPLKNVLIGGAGKSLWLLFGSVSLLLLIACTNIAALLLARTAEREHEISIRLSLGASRMRVMMQLLSETFVLALAGSVLGLAVAALAPRLFQFLSKDMPRVDEIGLEWRIVVYSLACALVTTLLCGLSPAWQATRRELTSGLAQGGRTQVGGRHGMQWTLVGLQVALAVTLLIGAGLLLRSFEALGAVNPGFDPNHVLSLRISASWGETTDMKKLTQRMNRTLKALRNIPGVEAAATAAMLPGVPFDYRAEFQIADGQLDANQKVIAAERYVSAGYFQTMKIPTMQGQTCSEDSDFKTVVNRSFANAYFGNSSAMGHHLTHTSADSFATAGEIRGVVADAREQGLNEEPVPTVYWCVNDPNPDPHFLVRTQGDPMAMAGAVRAAVHAVSPARSVYDVMPLTQHLDDAYSENRLRTLLLSLFAITALLLVSIGIYGSVGYLVRLRRREVGLRLALGAVPSQIMVRFLIQGLRVTLLGCAAGLAISFSVSHVLAGMLFGVSNTDAATYCGVVLLILAVASLASLIPAVRAARLDPTKALREE
jgi:predicted permease